MSTFKFNSENFKSAINSSVETKTEATSTIDFSNNVINSIPENCTEADNISKTCTAINQICNNIVDIPNILQEMYLVLSMTEDDINRYNLNFFSPDSNEYKMFTDLYYDGQFSEETLNKIRSGEITAYELICLSNSYGLYLADNPQMFTSLQSTENRGLKSYFSQFSANLPDDINKAMFDYLNNNNLMYTGEGAATAQVNLIGLLGSFGLCMSYGEATGFHDFDKKIDGFYLGTKNEELRALDCCNLYDWSCRCAGVGVSGYDANSHYFHGGQSIKEENGDKKIVYDYYDEKYIGPKISIEEIRCHEKDSFFEGDYINSDSYFVNGKPGDVLTGNGHLLTIISNDKEKGGYYISESGYDKKYDITNVHIRFYDYKEVQELRPSNIYAPASDDNHGQMYLSNMDSFFDNVTVPFCERNDIRSENFITPEELAENLNLSDEEYVRLQEQYQSRNKRLDPNYFIQATDTDSIVELAPTETPSSVETPIPTQTPSPVETSIPTQTPSPVETSIPAQTPSPVETSIPTQTPSPVETEIALNSESISIPIPNA